jgi:CII-binding regulator of phage lambda lysogenization HflD
MDPDLGEQALSAALEACLQLEMSKKLEEFSEAVREQGNNDVRALADALSSESRRVQAGLARMHAAVLHSQSKLEALTQVEKLMSA